MCRRRKMLSSFCSVAELSVRLREGEMYSGFFGNIGRLFLVDLQ